LPWRITGGAPATGLIGNDVPYQLNRRCPADPSTRAQEITDAQPRSREGRPRAALVAPSASLRPHLTSTLYFKMKFELIDYSKLSGKQQEIYTFQKLAGVLADYGFNCIKLADDWLGADFLAYHKDGLETLKVQLKGRLTIDQKYVGKRLHVAFPPGREWCVVGHDELVSIVRQVTNWLSTPSWTSKGQYHSGKPSRKLVDALKPYTLAEMMGRYRTIGQLFEEEPLQWGLRGDPYLWRAMHARFFLIPLPSFASNLDEQIEQAFQTLTGHALSTPAAFHVLEFAHGGMSNGAISPEFWREKALPLRPLRGFSSADAALLDPSSCGRNVCTKANKPK
jgi:hypothetical protein